MLSKKNHLIKTKRGKLGLRVENRRREEEDKANPFSSHSAIRYERNGGGKNSGNKKTDL